MKALQGRLLQPESPELGRWLHDDVEQMLEATWSRVAVLLHTANLERIPTLGNRHNVFLAVVTTAAFQALVENNQTKQHASDLVADVGWKVYELGIKFVSLPFRLTTRNPRKRMERTIRTLLKFPFNAPGRPGYEVKVESQDSQILTYWSSCPPQTFVRNLIERDGDKGELEAFYRSWCLYDWPGADIIAGDDERGHYHRTSTLSKGDPVCNMCWKYKIITQAQDHTN
ncbi:hypothetical protein [Sneathiella sp.]|jgi:hypothetical protein|uniref:hypothetical protein n=1 Tax=Sneathiella sp. TaxID=1964365 RepID=UPI000C39C028|nr:hypothetical protein [Sneathiella sp.]MAZ03909.1 hypothetical protein [Sneathiella sp.]|tara:strand:- start:982 stop:1665 length:684 start_codon:yes stop_codon:yes gene_type:complete